MNDIFNRKIDLGQTDPSSLDYTEEQGQLLWDIDKTESYTINHYWAPA